MNGQVDTIIWISSRGYMCILSVDVAVNENCQLNAGGFALTYADERTKGGATPRCSGIEAPIAAAAQPFDGKLNHRYRKRKTKNKGKDSTE